MPEGVKKIGLETTEIGLWAAKNAPMRPIDSTLYFDPKVIGFSELKKKLDRRKIRFAKTSLVDDMELIAAIVSSGVGIGLLATQTAKKQRNLRRLFPQDITYKAQINLAYRPDNTSSSGAQAVIAEFRKVPK
jgi:DNA-binding transcriptional LysR family regulator